MAKEKEKTTEIEQNALPGFEGMIEQPSTEEVKDVASLIAPQSAYSNKPVLDGSDMYVPRLRLAQGLTAEVQEGLAKPGQWIVSGYDPMDETIVIPLLLARQRELRDTDRIVCCRSSDAKTGDGNPGGVCRDCPMSKWIKGKEGEKNSPPPCTFSYSYMVYVVNAGVLAVLAFSRTSITTGKRLNTMIAQHGMGNFAVKMSSLSRSGGKGSFYLPIINPATVEPDILQTALKEVAVIQQ